MSPIDAARLRRSPLNGATLPDGVRELPFLAQIDVRLDAVNAVLMAAVADALGFGLPIEPNTVAGSEELAALWLGPDEWLIVGAPAQEVQLERSLRGALVGSGSIVDVSAIRTTLELRGPRVRGVLESGCSIDLHPRAFGPGDCAQTLVGQANVVLWQTTAAPEPTCRLLVRASYAAYMAAWLNDAFVANG